MNAAILFVLFIFIVLLAVWWTFRWAERNRSDR